MNTTPTTRPIVGYSRPTGWVLMALFLPLMGWPLHAIRAAVGLDGP